MEALIPIAVIIAFVGIVGLIIWLSFVMERKRREALEAAAQEMGLAYQSESCPNVASHIQQFKVGNSGRSRKVYNVIQGETDEVTIVIFDYRYTVGSGKHQSTYNQTIVLLESPLLVNPSFTMRPEGLFDKIGGAMGFQDIDFNTHPTFSQMFVLKSENEEACRNFFVPSLLEHFESKKGISVEANPGAMVFYRPRVRCKPDQLKDLFSEAYTVFGAMVDRGKA